MSNNIEIKIKAKTDGKEEVKSLGTEIKGLSSDISGLSKNLTSVAAFKRLRTEVKLDKDKEKRGRAEYQKYYSGIKASKNISAKMYRVGKGGSPCPPILSGENRSYL